MAHADDAAPVGDEVDAMAWEFLGSRYCGARYANWPIDRRLDAYLRHRGLHRIADNGSRCAELLERVMDNISPALSKGTLATHA
jgi:hypothetical protein